MSIFLILLCWAQGGQAEDSSSGTGGSNDGPIDYPEIYGSEWFNSTLPTYVTRPETGAPQPTKVQVRISRDIEIPAGQDSVINLHVAEIIVDFDQNLFVDDLLTREPIDVFTDQVVSKVDSQPKSSLYSKDLIQIVCGERVIRPVFALYGTSSSNGGGPDMNGTYVSGPVTSPFSSFLMSMTGSSIKEPSIPNRFTTLVLLKFGELVNDIDFSQCQLKFNNPNSPFLPTPQASTLQKRFVNIPHFIVNKQGTPLPPIQLTRGTDPVCVYSEFKHFFDTAMDVINKFQSRDLSFDDLGKISMVFQGLQSNVAYISCRNQLKALFTTKTGSMNVMTGTNCEYGHDDPSWATDPCCNQAVAQYQCCAPKIKAVPFTMVNTFNSATLNTCQSPDKVQALILSTMEQLRIQKLQASSNNIVQTGYTLYTDFFQTCNDQVYNQKCLTNSQCLSGSCSTQQGKCFIPWGNETSILLQCYLNQMKPELFFQIKSDLNLPFSNNVTEADVRLIKKGIEDKLSDFDCVGPSAYQLQANKQCTWGRGSNGYSEQVCIAADQSKCLSRKICNVKPFGDTTQEECDGIKNIYPNYCARCDQGFCYGVSRPSKCQVMSFPSISEENCEIVGGTFVSNEFNWGSQTECVFPMATTIEQCFIGDFCTVNDCQTFAYTSDTNEANCIGRNTFEPDATTFNWYDPKSICYVQYSGISNDYVNGLISSAQNDEFQINIGKNFQPGYLDTPEACADGFCDNYQVQTTDPTTCTNSGYCNRGCSKCISGNYDTKSQSGCVIQTNQTQCTTWSGSYESDTCVIQGSSATECASKDGRFATCNDYDQNQCGSDDLTSFMECKWSNYGNCENQNECTTNGECDDYEFQSKCEWDGICTEETNGVCLFDFEYDSNGYKSCPQQQTQWSRIGCINQNLQKTGCLEQSGVWKTRARSKEQCSAHGQMCFEKRNWMYSDKNATECIKCGGNKGDVYTWNSGIWSRGKMMSGKWSAVNYASENQYIKLVSNQRLQTAFTNSIAKIIGVQVLNSYRQSFLVPLLGIKQLSCLCNTKEDCFTDAAPVPQKQCRADPGVANDCSVTLPGSSADSSKVDIGLLPASQFANDGSTTVRSKLNKRITASSYSVIKFSGATVGQIIGDGKSFTFDKVVSSFIGCLDINQQIPQDTQYGVYDASIVLPSGKLSSPLKVEMTANGLQICGTFSQQGTYFPVLRVSADLFAKLEDPSSTSAKGIS